MITQYLFWPPGVSTAHEDEVPVASTQGQHLSEGRSAILFIRGKNCPGGHSTSSVHQGAALPENGDGTVQGCVHHWAALLGNEVGTIPGCLHQWAALLY